jgi:hypothetical protein
MWQFWQHWVLWLIQWHVSTGFPRARLSVLRVSDSSALFRNPKAEVHQLPSSPRWKRKAKPSTMSFKYSSAFSLNRPLSVAASARTFILAAFHQWHAKSHTVQPHYSRLLSRKRRCKNAAFTPSNCDSKESLKLCSPQNQSISFCILEHVQM